MTELGNHRTEIRLEGKLDNPSVWILYCTNVRNTPAVNSTTKYTVLHFFWVNFSLN